MVTRGISRRREEEEVMEAAEETSTDPAVMAAAASVLLSWYFFFFRGDRELGLFVGLWPPTILAFASYFQQTQMSDMVQRAMGKGGVVETIERVVQGR